MGSTGTVKKSVSSRVAQTLQTQPARQAAGLHKQVAGQQGEDRALAYLSTRGLTLLARNYRVAAGPSARAGEVDLVMRAADGTLVFVEVRVRASAAGGGAAASIGAGKRRRIIYAAQHWLARWRGALPPCRFDVVAIDGEALAWLPAAFDLDSA